MHALARFDQDDKQSTSDTCSDSQGAEVLNEVVEVGGRSHSAAAWVASGGNLTILVWWVIVGCVVLDEHVGVCWRVGVGVGVLVNCS